MLTPFFAAPSISSPVPSPDLGVPWLHQSVVDRFLVAIRMARHGESITSSRLSFVLNIPMFRVERAARALVNAGILRSMRGRSGGYELKLAPVEISALAIFEAGLPAGSDLGKLSALDQALRSLLRGQTLAELMTDWQ